MLLNDQNTRFEQRVTHEQIRKFEPRARNAAIVYFQRWQQQAVTRLEGFEFRNLIGSPRLEVTISHEFSTVVIPYWIFKGMSSRELTRAYQAICDFTKECANGMSSLDEVTDFDLHKSLIDKADLLTDYGHEQIYVLTHHGAMYIINRNWEIPF